jgi:hypothetical protein
MIWLLRLQPVSHFAAGLRWSALLFREPVNPKQNLSGLEFAPGATLQVRETGSGRWFNAGRLFGGSDHAAGGEHDDRGVVLELVGVCYS